jgi:hypothetical protein
MNALIQNPPDLTDEQLAGMDFGNLNMLRKMFPDHKEWQIRLAPFEHQAFARDYVSKNPVSGTLGLGVAIPAYQGAKALGFDRNSATPPSMNQALSGYKGIGQGILNYLRPSK